MDWLKSLLTGVGALADWIATLPEEQRQAAVDLVLKNHAAAKAELAAFIAASDADLAAGRAALEDGEG